MNTQPESELVPWYREPMAWLVWGVPALAVLSGTTMLWISIQSYDGLVKDDYYKRGLQINRDLSRDRFAQELSLGATASLSPAGGAVRVRFPGGRPPGVTRESVPALDFSHATRGGVDFSVTLQSNGDDFVGVMPALAPGRWYLRLEGAKWRLAAEVSQPVAKGQASGQSVPVELAPLAGPADRTR